MQTADWVNAKRSIEDRVWNRGPWSLRKDRAASIAAWTWGRVDSGTVVCALATQSSGGRRYQLLVWTWAPKLGRAASALNSPLTIIKVMGLHTVVIDPIAHVKLWQRIQLPVGVRVQSLGAMYTPSRLHHAPPPGTASAATWTQPPHFRHNPPPPHGLPPPAEPSSNFVCTCAAMNA